MTLPAARPGTAYFLRKSSPWAISVPLRDSCTDASRGNSTGQFIRAMASLKCADMRSACPSSKRIMPLEARAISCLCQRAIMIPESECEFVPSNKCPISCAITCPNITSGFAEVSGIQAGVKYMRSLEDQYFANEPMDPLNKALFTFAAYNAGPNRIRGLRKRAAERGLNSNLWFNNVEVVAAEAIGHETVQYVANIYKYYLAYQMLADQKEQRRKALAQTKKS